MNGKAQLLVSLLDSRYGLAITEDTAREDISNHVDHVAAMMRIGRQAAKVYVTDDVIGDMADRIGAAVERHHMAVRHGEVADLNAKRAQRGMRPQPKA